MRPLKHRLGARPVATGLGTLIVAAMIASLVVMPAFGAPPHEECESPIWNGEYYKVGIDDKQFEPTSVETSLSEDEGTIKLLEIEKDGNTAQVTWSNDTQYGVFRIYEKYGRLDDQITNESFAPGESDTFEIEKSISHITFCFGENPEVAIDKVTNDADPSTSNPNYIAAGDAVTWTYTVTNEGTVPLSNVTVTDSDSNVTPELQSGDTDGDGELDLGETWKFTASGTADASTSTWDTGNLNGYENTGTVTADFGDTQVSDSDDSGYYASDPSISIDCNFLTSDGKVPCEDGLNVAEGDEVVWEFTIENTGNVPLSPIVVKEKVDENTLEDLNPDFTTCDTDLDDPLNPGDKDSCTFTEEAVGGDTSEFVVIGTDPLSETTDATSGSVEYNVAPVANDDSYEVNERVGADTAATLEVPAPGVLDNDTDADGDTLSASDPTTPTNGGTVTLEEDGSFTYTPSIDYEWASDEFSRVDTWDYTVSDDNSSDVGTVEITVNRVVCTDETVTAEDGDVFGAFTLLSTSNPNGEGDEPDPCKAYSVSASEGDDLEDDLITLNTVPEDGKVATFRGELTFSPQTLDENDDFVLSLEYDPDGDGEDFQPLLICESATFDTDGLVIDATIPENETWCNAGWTSLASGGGEIVTVIQVFGEEDPGFSFR